MEISTAPKNSVTIPPIEVTYEDPETGDLHAVTVRTTIKDRSAYEVHAHKHGWPTKSPMEHAMFLWSGFLAWSALRREPDAPAILKTSTPDEFFDRVVDVLPVAEESEEDVTSPTPATLGSDGA